MNLQEALSILEIDEDVEQGLLKTQFRWLVWFYHPDNLRYGDEKELRRVIQAYDIVRKSK